MSLNRFAKQRDANEPELCAALRKVGALYYQTDRPTDLIVGFRGRIHLIEVKLPIGPMGGKSHSRPNPSQDRFLRIWGDRNLPVHVVRSVEELLHAIGARRGAPVAGIPNTDPQTQSEVERG